MIVDPADSSYMPSLVVVSGAFDFKVFQLENFSAVRFSFMLTVFSEYIGGSSLNNLIELKTININPTDTTVLLLTDCTEVSPPQIIIILP